MLVRKQVVKNKDGSARTYLVLIEPYREKGKVKHRYIATLGRADDPKTSEKVDRLLENLKTHAFRKRVLDVGSDFLAQSPKLYGPLVVFRRLWDSLKLGSTLAACLSERKVRADVVEAIFCMVLNRLVEPFSKRAAHMWKSEVQEPRWEALELQHFYRAMDFLEESAGEVENHVAASFLNLLNLDLDLVLMDTTTVMYDGEGDESELLAYGYSRDKRPDLKQVVVGVLMTKEGIPLGCEIFEGNLSDRKSFPVLWERARKRFPGIRRLVVVCDRGPVSKKNLEHLEGLGLDYIVGVRMRSLEESARLRLLSEASGFHPVDEEGNLEVKEVTDVDEEGKKRRYIVAWNHREDRYQKKKREAFRALLEKKVAERSPKEWVVKNGYKKYVKFTEGSALELDEERFEKEAIYDGKWVLLTSTDLPAREVALHYKGLALVERGFRSMKSEFEVHPMYHRVDRRIRAHVFLCFLALVLRQVLAKRLKELPRDPEKAPVSYGDVLRDLKKLSAVELTMEGKKLTLRTELEGNAYLAFQSLKMQPPPRVLETSKA